MNIYDDFYVGTITPYLYFQTNSLNALRIIHILTGQFN